MVKGNKTHPALTSLLVQVADKIRKKGFGIVLDRIEADALEFQLLGHVNSPVLDIFRDLWVVEVQVCKHEVIVVAVLCINIAGPMLAIALDLIQASLLAGIIVVGCREMVPVVLLGRVLGAPPRKIETQPTINLEYIRDLLVAILRIYLYDLAPLGLVCAGCEIMSKSRRELWSLTLVIENGIEVDANANLVGLVAEFNELFLVSPLGSDASFLVELAQVI